MVSSAKQLTDTVSTELLLRVDVIRVYCLQKKVCGRNVKEFKCEHLADREISSVRCNALWEVLGPVALGLDPY